jgi:lipopolysaccharide/colanic/teichoic acid biosynthesis glycosyltransferase
LEGHLNARSSVTATFEPTAINPSSRNRIFGGGSTALGLASAQKLEAAAYSSLHLAQDRMSNWSQSGMKRLFDIFCVLSMLPLLLPVFLAVGLVVRFTSHGPVFFLQKRMGRHNRTFTIFKFRSLTHLNGATHNAVTTTENQRFTPAGRFLRRWKLDELPQLLNVLRGDMSLVGPRPKLPEHQIDTLSSRPGITGAATIAFAREEMVLARVPKHHLDAYYHSTILPAKHRLDTEYMARATFFSDLRLIFDSILRRWDSSVMYSLIHTEQFQGEARMRRLGAPVPSIASTPVPMTTGEESFV